MNEVNEVISEVANARREARHYLIRKSDTDYKLNKNF